jgi:RNA polymerase primary sigma factor
MYLRRWEGVPLSREGEVEIAKKIEAGDKLSRTRSSAWPVAIKYVVELGAKLKRDEIRIKSVIDNLEDEDGFVEEDLHKQRDVKLIDRVSTVDRKNDQIHKRLKEKGIEEEIRKELRDDLEKNRKNIVRLCRKVRFRKADPFHVPC